MALESGGPRIAIDTETNGEDIRDGRGYCYGVSVAFRSSDGIFSFYMPFRHTNPGISGNYTLGRFLPVLQQILSSRVAIYHNATFDLISLSTLGLNVLGTQFLCTMNLCHLIDENTLHNQRFSLDACCKLYLGRSGKRKSALFELALKHVGWAGMTPELHGDYAAYDTFSTLELFEAIQPKLAAEQLQPIWLHKMKFIELLTQMEKHGVRVDTEMCEAQIEEGEMRMWEIEQELGGYVPSKRKDLEYLLIDQLKLPRIYHRKTKQPTFDKDAMLQYEEALSLISNPVAKLTLEYRGWQKTISSNYKAYLSLLSPDGRLRPNYNPSGTRTGRLSCERPNLQQIPKEGSNPWNGALKQCFVPEDGYTLLEWDYSQLEFRLLAAYAQEQSLLDAFADPTRDVFKEMSKTLGWPRQNVKTFVYSISYGAGLDRISFVFGVSKSEAKKLLDYFYSLYPGLRKAANIAKGIAIRRGYVPIWSGRRRHFQYPASESHKALNAIIQGGAADIVEHSMLNVAAAGFNDGRRSRMLLQVHDSLVLEVRNDDVADAKREVTLLMSNVQHDFGVRFKTEPKEWGLAA